jgi:outer membrane protein, multidrug efflux system
MKKQYRNILILGISLGILGTACVTIKESKIEPYTLPSTFSNKTDTANIGNLKVAEFFKDTLLRRLIDTALERNLDVKIASQKIEMALGDHVFSKGALWPTVNGMAFANPRKYGYYTMDDAGNRVTEFYPGKFIPTHLPDYFTGLQTAWEVDLWGKLRGRKKAAWSRYLSTVEGRNLWVTQLVDKVATSYYELVSLDMELELVRNSIKIQQEALDLMKVQKEASQVNELSVKQFQALWYHTQSLESEVLQKIQLIENDLNSWLNRFPQRIERNIAPFKQDSLLQALQTGVPSELLELRPDIRASEQELRASNADVWAAKAAFYPSLNITGSIGFQAFSTQFLFNFPQSIAYNLLGNLTGPLLNRSAIKSHFKKAKANQIEGLYRYQKTVLQAYFEVASELSNLKYLKEMEALKALQNKDLKQSVEIARELFLTGRANYLEVLTAQRNALDASMEWIRIKKAMYISNVHLYKALGGGW